MTVGTKEFFEEAATKKISLKGKIDAASGSYGWSGEAPKLVLEIMKNKFEMQVIAPTLLAKYAPDSTALEKCMEFGKSIAEKLMHKA
jgi:flavorubredoxin